MAHGYTVPFVDLWGEHAPMLEELTTIFQGVVKDSAFILRDHVTTFENRVAERLGLPAGHVVGVGNGTDALVLALQRAGVIRNDEVILPAHCFTAAVSAVVQCDAIPVLADVTADGLLDARLATAAITEKTRAIMPVHLNGRGQDYSQLVPAKTGVGNGRPDIAIVEDAAQALGATVGGRPCGGMGDFGCFSLHPMKIVGALGDGGLIACKTMVDADVLRARRNHGRPFHGDRMTALGVNSRLDNLQAALLLPKLAQLTDRINARRTVAQRYQANLRELPLVLPPDDLETEGRCDVFSSYVVQTPRRDELRAYLRGAGIETAVNWSPPIHLHPNLKRYVAVRSELPVTERLAREVLSLPCYPHLDERLQDRVIDAVTEFFRG